MVPNLLGTRDWFHGGQFFHGPVWGGDGSGSNVSDGEQSGAAEEASFTHSPLTSCCVARFLTGLGPVLGRVLGTPALTHLLDGENPLLQSEAHSGAGNARC